MRRSRVPAGMSDYTPIDCGIHDRLELTAVRRVPVSVQYVDPDGSPRTLTGVRLETIRVVDGAEFGVFSRRGEDDVEIRLDRIGAVMTGDGSVFTVSRPPAAPGSGPPAPSTPPASRRA